MTKIIIDNEEFEIKEDLAHLKKIYHKDNDKVITTSRVKKIYGNNIEYANEYNLKEYRLETKIVFNEKSAGIIITETQLIICGREVIQQFINKKRKNEVY